MRQPPGRLDKLFADGTLAKTAAECRTQAELAAKLGITSDAFTGWRIRRKGRGETAPTFDELRMIGRAAYGRITPPGVLTDEQALAMPFGAQDSTAQAKPAAKNENRTIETDLAERRERAEVSSLKARLKQALDQLEQCRYELDVATQVDSARGTVQPIERRERSHLMREATAVALASDWHIEETVNAAQVNGVNEYNVDIARQRAARFFSGFSYLVNYHTDHFAIRDGILWLGGDLITGYLREENLEHNQLSPVQAIAELHVWIADGIRSVLSATALDKLRVICNSGNHGRLTEKVRPSTREANSIEWLLYAGLAREFMHEPRVEFVLPHGSQTYVDVYDWTIRFTHGDETKFGGGVGGIMIPIRKAIAKWQTVRHADLTCLGHYHQEHFLRDLVVNGSLIGYNAYSLAIAAPYEDPRQSFFLIDSRRFISMPATIWVTDHAEAA